jgi:hypothetical protein
LKRSQSKLCVPRSVGSARSGGPTFAGVPTWFGSVGVLPVWSVVDPLGTTGFVATRVSGSALASRSQYPVFKVQAHEAIDYASRPGLSTPTSERLLGRLLADLDPRIGTQEKRPVRSARHTAHHRCVGRAVIPLYAPGIDTFSRSRSTPVRRHEAAKVRIPPSSMRAQETPTTPTRCHIPRSSAPGSGRGWALS